MGLLHFTQHYSVKRTDGSQPQKRCKAVVVNVRPYCSPDPSGPDYEQYCRQKLMLYKPFRCEAELLSDLDNYTEAYAAYLQTEDVPRCLEEDIIRLQQSEVHLEEHTEVTEHPLDQTH